MLNSRTQTLLQGCQIQLLTAIVKVTAIQGSVEVFRFQLPSVEQAEYRPVDQERLEYLREIKCQGKPPSSGFVKIRDRGG